MDSIQYERQGDVLFLRMPGEIDHHSSREIREITEAYLQNTAVYRLVFDFADTTFMDSSGVGMMMGRYKRMRERGGGVWIWHTGYQIRRILRIAGMEQLIPEWEEIPDKGQPTEN
jgi:stage II sporulation protein AA (anti-sigma F factor antagonist)